MVPSRVTSQRPYLSLEKAVIMSKQSSVMDDLRPIMPPLIRLLAGIIVLVVIQATVLGFPGITALIPTTTFTIAALVVFTLGLVVSAIVLKFGTQLATSLCDAYGFLRTVAKFFQSRFNQNDCHDHRSGRRNSYNARDERSDSVGQRLKIPILASFAAVTPIDTDLGSQLLQGSRDERLASLNCVLPCDCSSQGVIRRDERPAQFLVQIIDALHEKMFYVGRQFDLVPRA